MWAFGSLAAAVPAFWAGVFAYASFTGCFFSCAEPAPLAGILWTLVALWLLALPVAAGIAVARRGWRPLLLAAAGAPVLLAGVFLL